MKCLKLNRHIYRLISDIRYRVARLKNKLIRLDHMNKLIREIKVHNENTDQN